MTEPDGWDDDELDTRPSPFVRIVAAVVIVGLVIFIADLFFDLLVRSL